MSEDGFKRIFVSYARKDGVELALRLRKDLAAAGFEVWIDTEGIEGGARWPKKIEKAIDWAEVVLAVLTPGSDASDMCSCEQLRSLRKGKCVIPLLAVAGCEIPLIYETKNYREFTDERGYDASLRLLLNDIEGRKGTPLAEGYRTTRATYISAPPRVANYIERRETVHALRDTLFETNRQRGIALTALSGMGGIGKTVLAQALFDDEMVRDAFRDGLVWITAGREPRYEVNAKLREIAKALGGGSDETVAAETLYRTAIAQKAALIVIDDIWSKADLDPSWPSRCDRGFCSPRGTLESRRFPTRGSIGSICWTRGNRANCWHGGRGWRWGNFRRRLMTCCASATVCPWHCPPWVPYCGGRLWRSGATRRDYCATRI